MRIDIITVLPEMIEGFFNCSIMKRAQDKGLAEIHIHNLRDYTEDKYRRVDDYPFGGFAGMVDASALLGMEKPLLATSTDGVGTKIAIAQAMDVHDTIGQDLVGMVVDDIVVCGAEPLFMTDYIACGKVHPERIAAIVGGIAAACTAAGAALLGGVKLPYAGAYTSMEGATARQLDWLVWLR